MTTPLLTKKNEKAFALYVSIVLGQVSGVDTAYFSDAPLEPSFEPRSVYKYGCQTEPGAPLDLFF